MIYRCNFFFFLNSKSSNSLFVEIYIQDGCFSYRSSKNLPFCSIGDLLEFDISVSNFQILDLFFQFFYDKEKKYPRLVKKEKNETIIRSHKMSTRNAIGSNFLHIKS